MPKGSSTTLFVSSTCYDLAQVRADVKDFAEEMGLEPILSELDSFPVDPSQSTVQNCLDAVRIRADIFLLIVGGHYGSINETGKSITNLEYIEAAARGMPKYVFVKSEILSALPIWQANKEADFSSTVDTPKLFEFVAGLRNKGEVWVFPFGNAQDITRTLRKQLSYLWADSLAFRAKLQAVDMTALALSPDALRIFVEKPSGWEYLAFAKMLQHGVAGHYRKKLDLELGISYGQVIDLRDRHLAIQWVLRKFSQIQLIVSSMSQAMNGGINKAVGEPGEPGDIRRIEHLASRLADGYSEALDWTLEFKCLRVEPDMEKLVQLASKFSSNMLAEVELFSSELFGKLQYAFANHSPGDEVRFSLVLTVPDANEFLTEMQRLKKYVN